MKPAQIVEMVLEAGGKLALVGGKLKGKGLDENTRPLVRQHKAVITRLLTNPEPERAISTELDRKPCFICGGRDFIHGNDGGYFCQVCQPGIVGKPVRAGGNRAETAPGWYTPQQNRQTTPGRKIRNPLPPSFKKAAKWFLEHRPQLYQHGWTPGQLFRRNRSCGLAWVYIWGKPDLEVAILESGAIRFTFTNAAGRAIQQTAIPRGGMPCNSGSRR